MTTPQPSHLDTRDPANRDLTDIREEADRELDHYDKVDRADLVLLMPEDRWDEFVRHADGQTEADEVSYRGVRFRKAAVTAVVAQDGF